MPAATQDVVPAQAMPYRVPVFGTLTGVPGVPLVIGTTTPPDPLPTAMHVVASLQAIPNSSVVPGTVTGVPAKPLVMLTTTPTTFCESRPTATHDVALLQVMSPRKEVPETFLGLPMVSPEAAIGSTNPNCPELVEIAPAA